MSRRRKFSADFKREAFAFTDQPGVACLEIALGIGIFPKLLSLWKRGMKDVCNQAFDDNSTPKDEDLVRLKRELARVKKERDFFCAVAGCYCAIATTCQRSMARS